MIQIVHDGASIQFEAGEGSPGSATKRRRVSAPATRQTLSRAEWGC